MRLLWRARALTDLRAIFAHIAYYTDPGHAYERLADLRMGIERLLDNPDLSQRGDRRGERFIIVARVRDTRRGDG